MADASLLLFCSACCILMSKFAVNFCRWHCRHSRWCSYAWGTYNRGSSHSLSPLCQNPPPPHTEYVVHVLAPLLTPQRTKLRSILQLESTRYNTRAPAAPFPAAPAAAPGNPQRYCHSATIISIQPGPPPPATTPTLNENISRQFHTFYYYYCLTLFGNAFSHLFRHLSFTSSSGEERKGEERSVLFWAAGIGTGV